MDIDFTDLKVLKQALLDIKYAYLCSDQDRLLVGLLDLHTAVDHCLKKMISGRGVANTVDDNGGRVIAKTGVYGPKSHGGKHPRPNIKDRRKALRRPQSSPGERIANIQTDSRRMPRPMPPCRG